MSAAMQARIVHVLIERREAGFYYATSPDLRGLLVVEATIEELYNMIPQYIADLYEVSGQPVVVARLEDNDDATPSWVTTPVEIAERALKISRERTRLSK